MFNPTRACELLVGLPAVNVLDVVEPLAGRLEVTVESIIELPRCPNCGERAWVKDRPVVELVDLTCFGRPVILRWRKHRFWCPRAWCRQGSWTHEDPRIAAARLSVTDRAGRWATLHPGDSSDVYPIPLDWIVALGFHAVVAFAAFAAVARFARRSFTAGADEVVLRCVALLALFAAQALVGVYQSIAGLPAGVVVVHLAGVAAVWAGAVRVWLATQALPDSREVFMVRTTESSRSRSAAFRP